MKKLLRRFWQKLNQPKKSRCAIAYRGQPEQTQYNADRRVLAVMSCNYQGIAVTHTGNALFRMIRPLAEAQQCQPGTGKEKCDIVCNLDFRHYTGQDQRCPNCGQSFVPEVDFEVLQGVFHISSMGFIDDTISHPNGKVNSRSRNSATESTGKDV